MMKGIEDMRRVYIIAIIATIGLLAAACGGGGAAGAGGQSDRVTIEGTLTEFAFAPKSWEIPAGKPVRIVIHNKGTLEHDFTIDALKIAVKAQPGKDTIKDFNAIAPGTYDVHCSVAGHKESGMVAKLVVK